jgi:aspartyl-tRNA(Asn)/glutamyl-tRNA(Gln) amidotransferase subunit A
MAEWNRFDPFCSLTDLAEQISDGTVSPSDAVEAYLDRIDEYDAEINAYTTVIEEKARHAARDAAETLDDEGRLGPLHGIPIALKDLGFAKEGVQMTSGLKLLADMGYVAEKSAATVERLEDAGAIVIGMTNTPELGHKLVTDNEYIGATATPFDTEYNAGGSSGGSAAAVATGMAAAAIGSDMGGSIRVPATACGVFGLKPSYGLVPSDSRPSAFGGETHHSTGGPITRSVEDAAVIMDVMAGQHPRDPTSVPVDIDFTGAVSQPVDDLCIAYTPDLDVFDVDEEVVGLVEKGVEALEDTGATVEETTVTDGIDLTLDEFVSAMEDSGAKAFADGQEVFKQSMGVDLRDHADTVSDSMIEAIEIGYEVDSTDEASFELLRTNFFDAVQDVFDDYDLLITPVMARKGLELHSERGIEFENYLTFPFNFTGHPASSVPVGLTEEEGLPVGMQIVGRRYADDTVLTASAAIERERPWHDIYSQLSH